MKKKIEMGKKNEVIEDPFNIGVNFDSDFWDDYDKGDLMEGKEGWTMFMIIDGVKMYSNGKEIRNQYGERQAV